MKTNLLVISFSIYLSACSGGVLNLKDSPSQSNPPTSLPPSSMLPTYQSSTAIWPGFVWESYVAGVAVTVDFGQPTNGATAFQYSFYRNGVEIPGTQGVTSNLEQSYTPNALDSGTILSCIVTPSNSLGSGESVTIPGIYIN